MDAAVFVYADLNGEPVFAGTLFAHARGNRESATFEYDEDWLGSDERFALDPALQLTRGAFHTGGEKPLFGAIGDSAPDRWGRVLMRRAERRRAETAGETPRTLREIDFLLRVNDEARMGALRFAAERGGSFLAPAGDTPIPPLIDLLKLLSAAQRVDEEDESDEDLRLILAPGSSLGGARPKASVRDMDGSLAIAKFPRKDDQWNDVLWEALALTLAENAGITVPRWRTEKITDKDILLVSRFDREHGLRVPFLSAMSMIGAKDGETRSYFEIADALRLHGAQAKADLQALWRRIAFTVLISNVDDHMRNHGFLYDGSMGWVLSPAYDLNPVPVDVKPRVLSTAIDEEHQTASLELALSVAEYFELKLEQARTIAAEVGAAVAQWRAVADKFGIAGAEIKRMESAFVHDDLRLAESFAS